MDGTALERFRFYYVFTAKSLQNFILRGDKLRLMVGGSALIEGLAESFFGGLLKKMGLQEEKDYLWLSAAAGAARLLFRDEEAVKALTQVVPVALALHAPELEFAQTFLEVKDNLAQTMQETEKHLQARRNLLFPSLPVAGPLVRRCPRSGRPAVAQIRFGSDREWADEAMKAKGKALSLSRESFLDKVLPKQEDRPPDRLKLPLDFSHLSRGEREHIAIVHIDGNGLGSLVMQLFHNLRGQEDDAVVRTYRAFSTAIQQASEGAFRKALGPLVDRSQEEKRSHYPFRPLICAGDDVTVVLRAADAFTFTCDFLAAFERTSAEALKALALEGLPPSLTACAGIVYVKKKFPFAQAYDLCESLCSFAKTKTDRKVSALAFWRVTTTAAETFETILERELTFPDDEATLTATMMPYVIGQPLGSFGSTDALVKLKEAVKAMPRGSLRQLLSEIPQGKARTQRNFERVSQVNRSRQGREKETSSAFDDLESALAGLTGSQRDDVLFRQEGNTATTPLFDAIELLAAERGQEGAL